jgi:hypothetical protein
MPVAARVTVAGVNAGVTASEASVAPSCIPLASWGVVIRPPVEGTTPHALACPCGSKSAPPAFWLNICCISLLAPESRAIELESGAQTPTARP